jgi:sulfur-carrier protein
VAAGVRSDELAGDDVEAVLDAACSRYGTGFGALLASCGVWVNGEAASGVTPVREADEVAILPPISGGAA